MKDLNKGAVSFRKKDFDKHKDLFGNLSDTQKPHTIFIGCSDSRLVPSLITSTIPGELFIIRSVANIVPPYKRGVNFPAISAAIEYAVLSLGVENIIVCGHSNCGGCELCINRRRTEGFASPPTSGSAGTPVAG